MAKLDQELFKEMSRSSFLRREVTHLPFRFSVSLGMEHTVYVMVP